VLRRVDLQRLVRGLPFRKMYSYPKPSRPSGVPLLIGGHSSAAARRAGRLAQGMFALADNPETAATLREEMCEAARLAGRGTDELELTVGRPPSRWRRSPRSCSTNSRRSGTRARIVWCCSASSTPIRSS
jgi:hypothetical protein